MDTAQQDRASLRAKNEKLRLENDDLKLMLGLVKENVDLRAQVQSSSSDITTDSTGRKTVISWQDTIDEGRFRSDLQQTNAKCIHKTSSPINYGSLTKNSMPTEPKQKNFEMYSSAYISQKVKDPERLVGEIAFQLDRRILAHIFQGQARLYGFTVLNVREKIVQVSTHPLTGKVDEGYRLQLSQRYTDLTKRLNQLGYSISLHPTFTEFVINTYGILKQRPDVYSNQEQGYNNPDFLRKVLVSTAPSKLLKDLLLLLSCLSYMARQDGKPLFLW